MSHAQVTVGQRKVGEIDQGILVFVGMEKSDQQEQADKLLHRLLNYRIFADHDDKMNLSVSDIKGGILLVPQFTLAADTRKGMRPSFSAAKQPQSAEALFEYLLQQARKKHPQVQSGKFGENMQVTLTNDGPVTFSLTV